MTEKSSSRPLSINEPKNNAKKIKWLVEPIGILVIYNVLPEEERIVHLMRFRSSRARKSCGPTSFPDESRATWPVMKTSRLPVTSTTLE